MVQHTRRKRIAEQKASCLTSPEPSLLPCARAPDEVQRAAKRGAIERGLFLIKNLMELDFASLIRRVEQISQEYDKGKWYETAADLCIDAEALKTLDACEPPIPYPYYFCTPDILVQDPELVVYYRSVAMVPQKVMNDMGLNTISYETGQIPTPDIALDLARRLNRIISALVTTSAVTPQRHLEMAYSSLGASLDDLWRNQIRQSDSCLTT